jgi:hypothetical protein
MPSLHGILPKVGVVQIIRGCERERLRLRLRLSKVKEVGVILSGVPLGMQSKDLLF